MDGFNYCERHQRAFELMRIAGMPGWWMFECPQCRQEGRYATYATTSTTINPLDPSLFSDHVIKIKTSLKVEKETKYE